MGKGIEKILEATKKENGRVFIFSARRGLAPNTVCGDCGIIVLCNTCKAPTVLHTKDNDNFFLCHRCGETRDAGETCRICGSWKLVTLGVGIEAVEKWLKEKFPTTRLFRVDRDSISTHARALEIIKKFEKTPGAILLGTEMAVHLLNERVEVSIIATIDSLFSIPDFQISEKIFSLLLSIRSQTNKKFILQTRNSTFALWQYLFQGNLLDFYRDEISGRETLKYPPFSTFIKVSLQGQKNRVREEMEKFEKEFSDWKPIVFNAFIPEARGKFMIHGLIRLPRGRWIDKKLLTKLLSLPSYFSIRVDPESVL